MIIFKSGKSIIADENHLWIVRTKKLLKTYRSKNYKNNECSYIKTTKELYEELKNFVVTSDGYKYFVPIVRKIYGDYTNHGIPPYVLGVLLGDGCVSNENIDNHNTLYISNNEEDIIAKVAKLLNSEYKLSLIHISEPTRPY